MFDHGSRFGHLPSAQAARRLHLRSIAMTELRTTAEYNTQDLMSLIATSGSNDRITAKMPAVTLEELLKPEPLASYATGGTTALPLHVFPRGAVIAISAALTVLFVLLIVAI